MIHQVVKDQHAVRNSTRVGLLRVVLPSRSYQLNAAAVTPLATENLNTYPFKLASAAGPRQNVVPGEAERSERNRGIVGRNQVSSCGAATGAFRPSVAALRGLEDHIANHTHGCRRGLRSSAAPRLRTSLNAGAKGSLSTYAFTPASVLALHESD